MCNIPASASGHYIIGIFQRRYNRIFHRLFQPGGGGGVLCIFWVRGPAIGNGINFHDFGIRNGIDFHDLVQGTVSVFAIFTICIGSGLHFRKIGIKSGIYFLNIGITSGIHFGKIGIRNGYVFETSMARPRPKAGQVPPPRATSSQLYLS